MLLKPREQTTILDVPVVIVSSDEVEDVCSLFRYLRGDSGQIINLQSSPSWCVVWNGVEISLIDFVEELETDNNPDRLLLFELKGNSPNIARDVIELVQRVFYKRGESNYVRLILFS